MPDAAPVTMATACMYLRLSSYAAAGVTDSVRWLSDPPAIDVPLWRSYEQTRLHEHVELDRPQRQEQRKRLAQDFWPGALAGAKTPTASDDDSAGQLLQRMQESQADFVQPEFCDFIGVSRSRVVRSSAIGRDRQTKFPYVNIAHDVGDGEPDPEAMGPHTGSFWLSPDVSSYVPLPYLSRTGSVMCWLTNPDGSAYGGCARTKVRHLAGAIAE